MAREERLKKRAAAPRNRNNDINPLGHLTNSSTIKGVFRSGTQNDQATTTRAKNLRRYKGSKSRKLYSFLPYNRIARALSLQNIEKNGRDKSTGLKIIPRLLCIVGIAFVFFRNDENGSNTRKLRNQAQRIGRANIFEFNISFSKKFSGNISQSFFEIDSMESGMQRYNDYGGLDIQTMGKKRQILDSDYLSDSSFRPPGKSRDDDGNDAYLAFDDDYLRGTEGTLNENPLKKICRRTSNHRLNFQNCNTIFEIELLSNRAKYLK